MEVLRGEVACVMGTNGVGKTSLMKAIAGRHARSGGLIELDGRSLGTASAHQLAKTGIAYVPQGREIFPLLTVLENLEIGFGCLPQAERHVPDRIYDLFPVLHDMRHRRGGDLSGGQQQQLAIARALITRPKLLLLDEPTEGIQPSIIREMARTLRKIRDQKGLTIVVSEQVLSFALDVADRVMVIENGTFVHDSPRDGLDEALVSKFLSV